MQKAIDDYCGNHGEHDSLVRAYRGRRKLKQFDSASSASQGTNGEVLTWLSQELGLQLNHSRPADAPLPASSSSVSSVAPIDKTPHALTAETVACMGESHLFKELEAKNANFGAEVLNASAGGSFQRASVVALLKSRASAWTGDGRAFVELLLNCLRGSTQLLALDEAEGGDAALADLILKAMDANWAVKQNVDVLSSVWPIAPLSFLQLLASKGGSKVKDKQEYVGAVLARLVPPHGTAFKEDKAALNAYLAAVASFLDTMPPAAYPYLRECVLYHRLKLLLSIPPSHASGDLPSVCSTEGTQMLEQLLAVAPRARFPYNEAPMYSQSQREDFSRTGAWMEHRQHEGSNAAAHLAVPLPQQGEVDELVRHCLLDILGRGTGAPGAHLAPWSRYVSDSWLQAVQAEARLTRGTSADLENAGAWGKSLPGGASALQSLKEKVVLEFDQLCNPAYLPAGLPAKPLTLHVGVKNVPRLSIRVYEVNTLAYYTAQGKEVPTDIALDGLLPSVAYTYDFTGPQVQGPLPAASLAQEGAGATAASTNSLCAQPLRLHHLQVPLPSLSEPGTERGVWVVEIIGGGRSCRAVLRRGGLRFVERATVAGHLITVIGEDNVPLPADRVSVHLAGRRYTPESTSGAPAAGEDPSLLPSHEILVPHTHSRTSTHLILCMEGTPVGGDAAQAWPYASVLPFTHYEESYTLEAAWALERESVVRDNYFATVLIRAKLLLHNEIAAPLAALSNVSLRISAVDAAGSVSERVERNLSLSSDKELPVSFAVPADVRSLSFALTCDVEHCSGHAGAKSTLTATFNKEVNGIDKCDDTRDVHMRYTQAEGYTLLCLGKTGEPCAGVGLDVALRTAIFQEQVDRSLRSLQVKLLTNAEGKAILGHLPSHIVRLSVSGPWGSGSSTRKVTFELPQDTVTYPTVIHTLTSVPALRLSAVDGDRSSSLASVLGSLLGGSRGQATVAVPTAAGSEAEVVARFPFRPDVPKGTSPASYKLSSKDFKLVEVRPCADQARSAAWLGASHGLGGATAIVANAFHHAKYDAAAGMIVVTGLPAGWYHAQVKRPYPGAEASGPLVTIRALYGPGSVAVAGQLASGNVHLQVTRPGIASAAAVASSAPLQITSVTVDHASQSVLIRVNGGVGSRGGAPAYKDVRVHVLATHFVPHWDCGDSISAITMPGLSCAQLDFRSCKYLNGRTLGEEQRYVLERQEKARAGRVLPGNLLPRPRLLLNPVSLGHVGTETQDAEQGDEYANQAANAVMSLERATGRRLGKGGAAAGTIAHAAFVTVDFLARPAQMLVNLRPEAGTGLVSIPFSTLLGVPSARQEEVAAILAKVGEVYVSAIAVDALHTVSTATSVPLIPSGAPAVQPVYRDLASGASTLDPDSHVLQRSQTAVLAVLGQKVEVAAAASFTKAEVYATLDRAAGLLSSLSGGAAASLLLRDFSWLLQWPALSPAQRAGKYSKWACHEVHAWLWWKDPQWFDATVAPFLACKRSMTLVDHFLLGTSLAALAMKQGGAHTPEGGACAQRAAAHWRALRTYATPSALARLNAFERCLVMTALTPAQSSSLARAFRDAVQLQPLDSETQQRVFKAALASNALSGARDDEIEGMLAEADRASAARQQHMQSMSAPPPPPPHAAPPGGAMFASAPMAMSMPMARAGGQGLGFGSAPMAKRAAMPMARRMMAAEPMSQQVQPAMAMRGAPAPQAYAAFAAAAPMADFAFTTESMVEDAGYAVQDEVLLTDDVEEGDMALRDKARAVYQPLDKTEEYAEAGYFKVHRDAGQISTQGLVPMSQYWADFAAHIASCVAAVGGGAAEESSDDATVAASAAAVGGKIRSTAFVSSSFALPAVTPVTGPAPNGPFTAVVCALACLGLPMEREVQEERRADRPAVALNEDRSKIVYTAGRSPAVLFYRDISTLPPSAIPPSSTVLVGQAYLDPKDPSTYVQGKQVDKFLPTNAADGSVEVVAGKVYQCRVVISNISSSTQSLTVLLHIPHGSLPCSNGTPLSMKPITLNPYETKTMAYPFYLPRPGSVRHFPVHVYADGAGEAGEPVLVAYAQPVTLRTVDRPSVRDTTSWAYVAANGTAEEIMAFLERSNVSQQCQSGPPPCPLHLLLWRLAASSLLWSRVVSLLRARGEWNEQVWELAFKHGDVEGIREYLSTEASVSILRARGHLGALPSFSSPLLELVGEEGVGVSTAKASVHKGMADAPSSGHMHRGRGRQGGGSSSSWDGIPYEHLEYSPLVNARAHQLGAKRRILNHAVARQWKRLLLVLACKHVEDITASDRTAASYLLLLQDRVEEALEQFELVTPPTGSIAAAVVAGKPVPPPVHAGGPLAGSVPFAPTPWPALQYDYMAAYMDFYSAGDGRSSGGAAARSYQLPIAAAVAAAYRDHPVPKWNARFKELAQQLSEAGVGFEAPVKRDGGAPAGSATGTGEEGQEGGSAGMEEGVGTDITREGATSSAQAKEPSLELTSEGSSLVVTYSNLPSGCVSATLRLYAMDLELLFSTSPFSITEKGAGAAAKGGMFSYVRPNYSQSITLPALASATSGTVRVSLPSAYGKANLMCEVSAAGIRRTVPYYATGMTVTVTEAFGRLRVTDAATGAPLSRVYVKVYGSQSDGSDASSVTSVSGSGSDTGAKFLKDCYTDARGVADYCSLSTDELSKARRLAILVSSTAHGALVRTATPPGLH